MPTNFDEKEIKPFSIKDYYRGRIIEMVRNIKNVDILEYIYKMIADIMRENR